MHVISEKALRDFIRKHANAESPLKAWLKVAEHGSYKSHSELKQTFRDVDMVPVKRTNLYVFNIGGNKYRLVAAIHFNTQRLFIRHVLTHAEYSTGAWKK